MLPKTMFEAILHVCEYCSRWIFSRINPFPSPRFLFHHKTINEQPKFSNSGDGPLVVPGFGDRPVNDRLEGMTRCLHGANDWNPSRLTVREISMLRLMDALTDKPNWSEKVFDEEIVKKWHDEALTMPSISEKSWEWCLAELRDKAAFYDRTKLINTLNTKAGCCKSDTLVPTDLREQLQTAVKPLLETEEKDWHPDSNEQVLNLVHPSLFPLVYDRTRVITGGEQVCLNDTLGSCGRGEVIPAPSILETNMVQFAWDRRYQTSVWSARFQWLPCEVKFAESEGTNVHITSYVNNLHPSNKALYRIIEQFISLSIQPWNEVLITAANGSRPVGRFPYRIQTLGADFEEPFPEWAYTLPLKEDPEYGKGVAKVKEYMNRPNVNELDGDEENELGDWEEDGLLYGAVDWKYRRLRKVKHPEAGEAYTFEDWKVGKTDKLVVEGSSGGYRPRAESHRYSEMHIEDEFRQQGLQVIVKLASIELTPEKPEYSGGNWHLEGMLNEHIAATAIYYYDVENVTQARLSFRQEADMDMEEFDYGQDDHGPLSEIFGTESLRDEKAIQELGSIATPEGRLLVFPNVLQHRVEGFKLQDPTRPGHRRFLVLWLVDPYFRLLSTANVPPQRHDWWAEEGYKKLKLDEKLPVEIEQMVKEGVAGWPMGLEEAKKLRLDLMAERTQMMPAVDEHIEMYNFCEH